MNNIEKSRIHKQFLKKTNKEIDKYSIMQGSLKLFESIETTLNHIDYLINHNKLNEIEKYISISGMIESLIYLFSTKYYEHSDKLNSLNKKYNSLTAK